MALVQGTSGFSIAKTEALAKPEEMTERYSKEIGSELQYGMDTARSAAASLEALKETNNTDRKLASGILKEFLLRNPRILGTWVIYEGNAFDGKDAEHQKEP